MERIERVEEGETRLEKEYEMERVEGVADSIASASQAEDVSVHEVIGQQKITSFSNRNFSRKLV